jgi:hypothetical protein
VRKIELGWAYSNNKKKMGGRVKNEKTRSLIKKIKYDT